MANEVTAGPGDLQVDLRHGLGDTSRYGDWRENKKSGRYLVPSSLSGSDYSGGLSTRSNYEHFEEEFASGENEWWTSVSGGHGTYAIVIDLQSVPDDVASDVADLLNGLHDHPIANEDLHSELEMEAQNEAWERWARREFKQAIEKKFDVDLDKVDDEQVFSLFRDAADRANENWEEQGGGDVHINIDRIVKKVTKADVKDLLVS